MVHDKEKENEKNKDKGHGKEDHKYCNKKESCMMALKVKIANFHKEGE